MDISLKIYNFSLKLKYRLKNNISSHRNNYNTDIELLILSQLFKRNSLARSHVT